MAKRDPAGNVATARPCGSRTRASLARPWRPPASRRARVGQRRRLPVPAANAEALHLRARARTLTFHGFTLSLRFRYGPTYRLGGLLGAAALERIQQGDGDASLNLVADLLATLRINEATNRAAPYRPSILDQAAVIISLTVRHAPPSGAVGWARSGGGGAVVRRRILPAHRSLRRPQAGSNGRPSSRDRGRAVSDRAWDAA